jgi:ubiquinone biosynthesis monooxygenase Coq7|tara:strand:- start:37 stop:699 length:663 start_codon:yes stop_codon:yes gene_type:complete
MITRQTPGQRSYSEADHWLIAAQNGLTTIFGQPNGTGRSDPSEGLDEPELEEAERDQSARLMRVNHVGEVCAQALYQSQAAATRDLQLQQTLAHTAAEENDHLIWCDTRLQALGGRKSLLNPLWYTGAFVIGAVAGLAGDRWSLGFLKETEEQVEGHLDSHLGRLPAKDTCSRVVVQQMKEDERRHAERANRSGATDLPTPIKSLMRGASRVMTGAAHWI